MHRRGVPDPISLLSFNVMIRWREDVACDYWLATTGLFFGELRLWALNGNR